MSKRSPIVLFTYLRLEALKLTVNALVANHGASESELIIFSDGPKYTHDVARVNEIRTYLKTIHGFKSVSIHESNYNKGLAISIIQGVSIVLNEYPTAIVLEDDLITSNNFLAFMNASLNRFENYHEVTSISGYAFDFSNMKSVDSDGYFLNRAWSWGWATWSNRWQQIDWKITDYLDFELNQKKVDEFAKLGSDVNKMLSELITGTTDSWYIRFVYHQFKMKGLTYYPLISKVNNNGFDALATHNKGLKTRFITNFDLSEKCSFEFHTDIQINKEIQMAFLKKMSLKARLINRLTEFVFCD